MKARKAHIKNMEADDVAQELRIHLWKNIDKYDPKHLSGASEKTFVNVILNNKIRSIATKANKDQSTPVVFDEAFEIKNINKIRKMWQ